MKNQMNVGEKIQRVKKMKSEIVKAKTLKKNFKREIFKKQGRREEEFVPPKWWDCGWKRIPCGKPECPLCSREMSRQIVNTMRGKDPDDLEVIFEDLANDLLEIKKIIAKDAKKFGIDIKKIEVVEMPKIKEPEDFPLYAEIGEWRKKVHDVLDSLYFTQDLWVYTEEAADLAWYSNTFFAKTARQLGTRAEIEVGLDFVGADYEYTREVLKKCASILRRSLESLYAVKKFSKTELNFLGEELLKLEGKALKI